MAGLLLDGKSYRIMPGSVGTCVHAVKGRNLTMPLSRLVATVVIVVMVGKLLIYCSTGST